MRRGLRLTQDDIEFIQAFERLQQRQEELPARFDRRAVNTALFAYLAEQRPCPKCGTQRRLKEQAMAPFHTLFGVALVPNPRWEQCDCQPQPTKTLRPLSQLLPERTSPDLLYLETKWASLVPYELTAKLLHEGCHSIANTIPLRYAIICSRQHNAWSSGLVTSRPCS